MQELVKIIEYVLEMGFFSEGFNLNIGILGVFAPLGLLKKRNKKNKIDKNKGKRKKSA